jgi:hypothetical protein
MYFLIYIDALPLSNTDDGEQIGQISFKARINKKSSGFLSTEDIKSDSKSSLF